MKAFALLIGLAMSLTLIWAPVSGQQAGRCTLPGFPAPELCGRAGLDTVPASYLFVVDESGSMQPLWSGVRTALGEFAAAIPQGSELDVRVFATGVQEVIPATRSDARTRQLWSSQVQSLPAPRGQHTDLGLAASSALERVSSAPAERLQFVFFLTDGIHDPAPSSPFAAEWNPAWEKLATEAARLRGSRPLRVGLVRLSPSANVQLLTRLFPDAVVTDAMSTAALQQWFANVRRQAAVTKLQLLIERDVERPFAVLSSDEPIRTYSGRAALAEITVTSPRQILTTELPGGTELALPGGGTLKLREPLRLSPGERRSITAEVRDLSYLPLLPPGVMKRSAKGKAEAEAALQPADELGLIGAASEGRGPIELNLVLAGGGILSWPAWIIAVLVLLAALAYATVRVKWAAHRAYLPGRLLIRHAERSGEPGAEETVVFNGKRKGAYTVVHPDGRTSVQLEARSEKGRTVVYAVPTGAEVTVGGKRLSGPIQVTRVTRFESEPGEITFLPN